MRVLFVLLLAAGCRSLAEDSLLVDVDLDGFVAADDCDDNNAAVHPDAAEACNGLDDDCNGTVDDTPEGVGDPFYTDRDGDGYGTGDPIYACASFDGVATLPGDCNDASEATYPGAPEPDCSDPTDYDCDGFGAAVDVDGDGSPSCLDCDDDDPLAKPGGVELCDGRDGDCDGVVDGPTAVNAPTWYLDGDRDLFGDPETGVAACAAPPQHVADNRDCDDTKDTIHPGADEICDGEDQDCDGSEDENAVDAATWYLDADSDTFGGTRTLTACDQPRGYVDNSLDCNDLDRTAYPRAQEVCDGDDEDCDDEIDEQGALGETVWFADPDGDQYGDARTGTLAACNQPRGYAELAGDCAEGDPARYPGADEVCNGLDDDCDDIEDNNAIDASRIWADVDGDSYGNPDISRRSCRVPTGWVENNEDCDDTARRIHPGADEICNGHDDDCDGSIDNDAIDERTWYADTDGDGFGVSRPIELACRRPDGFAPRAGDCAPDDRTIHPEADERCDDIDRNCDDDPTAGAIDAPTWYADVDRDGFGGDLFTQRSCDRPRDFLGTAEDCNDLDGDIHPDARDICGDGIDQDCADGDRTGANGETPECAATSCVEVLEVTPRAPDGPYWIDSTGTRPVQTTCDLRGGGWMLGFTKNSVHQGLYHDFGSGYVDTGALTTHPAAASSARGPIAGWLDLNEASYDELQLRVYWTGSETWRSEGIDRGELRIDFGQDGYFLYGGASGYYWCGGTHAFTDLGQGQVNRPNGAPADCKGHGSLGDGWDFSHLDATNRGLTMCGTNHSRWMHYEYGGRNVSYPGGGAAQAIWVR